MLRRIEAGRGSRARLSFLSDIEKHQIAFDFVG